MTNWQPAIDQFEGPRYLAIASALADDIKRGRLRPGDRLPTHRELAWRLGVTVGTVSRAYAEAERRGLTSGEVGRGTFVRRPDSGPTAERIGAIERQLDQSSAAIGLNIATPCPVPEADTIQDVLLEIVQSPDLTDLMGYQPPGGDARARGLAARWLALSGLEVAAEQTVVAAGAHNALLAVLAAVARPGHRIAAERMTYAGLPLAAHLLGLRLEGLELDEEGLSPAAFEAACRGGDLRALYCIPTLHNPTTATMSLARRRDIVEIARRHDVAIIEDDIFGLLSRPHPVPLAALAPERGYLVSSLSKTVAPGLRIGFAAAPRAGAEALAHSLRAINWMTAPVMLETAMRLIESGAGERIMNARRAEAEQRRRILLDDLAAWRPRCPEGALFAWLELPEDWDPVAFATAAAGRGVQITPAETFTIGRRGAAHGVRLAYGGPGSRAELRSGLAIIARLLQESPLAALGAVV